MIHTDLEKNTKGLSDKQSKRELLKASLDQLMEEQEEVSAKLFTLKNTGNFEEVERIHRELSEAKKKAEKIRHQIEESKEDEISLGYKIKETEDQKYQHQKETRNIWENLDGYAWELDLPFHQEYKDETSYELVSGFKEQGNLFKNHLEECLKLIEEKESNEGKLDAEKTKGILSQNKIHEYQKTIKRYEEEYEESKIYLIKEIKSYAAYCQVLELDSHINGITRLIEEEKWENAKAAVFELFYEKNNHYQERNGYIKACFEKTADESLRKELDKNILKAEMLKKEYFGFPAFKKIEEIKEEIQKNGYYLEKENEFFDRQEENQAVIENIYGIILKKLQETVSKYGFLYQMRSEKYSQLLKMANDYMDEIHQMEKEIQNFEMCEVMLHTYGQREEELAEILMDLRYQKEETDRTISQLEHRLDGLKTDVEQEELFSLSKRSEENRNQIASMKAEISLLETAQIPEMEEKVRRDYHALEEKGKELSIVKEHLIWECRWKGYDFDQETIDEEIRVTGISVEESMDNLINIYKDHETDMLLYQPRLERKMVAMDYSRYFLTFKNLLPKELLQIVTEEIRDKEGLLDEQETTLYQKVLLDTAAQKMIYKIKQSKYWVDKISERMRNLKTTSGMVFNLKWVPKKAETQNEIDTSILEQIISKKQKGRIGKEDLERIKNHFSSKLKQERIYAANEGLEMDYEAIIKNCFDYRNWYEFKMFLTEPGFKEKELTNKRFMSLSGGERATAIYSSLLSALNSLYSECEIADHPRFMGLDEAFTVCDSSNTDAVFEFISQMDLEYLLNSQTLWGTYPSVKNLAISHLTHDEKSRSVAITRFTWNGKERRPVFTGM
ncbi:MAG: SbcC/MukB-like Walker B domain-containing protein [Eubacteriales bacterium]|nr:SbcC/MukB-like Walker B domain-containing protein [Eubacteriales bacterium]